MRPVLFPSITFCFLVFFAVVSQTQFVVAADPTCQNFNRPLLFGINPGGNINHIFEAIATAGGTATKLVLNWDISERNRGSYEFSQLDADVSEAQKQNLALTLLVTSTPEWAKEGSLQPHKALPKREFTQEYKRFIQTVARRYPQLVRYEYWNEQNGCGSSTGYCGNTDESVREYAYWLDVTYQALKEVNVSIQLSVGGLDGMDDAFVERLHASPGGRSYDVFSIHPYNWHGAINFDGVKRLHQMTQKPIWITEYGWNVLPGAGSSITESQGAEYLTQTLQRLTTDEFSFVTAAFFHTIADFSSDPAMGLIDAQGNKRAWYQIFRGYATRLCPQVTPSPTPTPTPSTVIPQNPTPSQDLEITITTKIKAQAGLNTEDGTQWSKVALIANNGSNYDGPYDYADCSTGRTDGGCGTPNLYRDKQIDAFELTVTESTHTTHAKLSQLIHNFTASGKALTKLSYLFYNDYWKPGEADRSIAITAIDFTAPDGTLLLSFRPSENSQFGGYSGDAREVSFYFDMGLINAEGISNTEQDGFADAFDKQYIESIVEHQSRETNEWKLDKEGSFNVVTTQLHKKVIEKYGDLWSQTLLGDLNKDRVVDIFDHNLVVELFSQDSCSHNQVGDCKIDIYDFNTVVENFGKRI